MSAGYLVFCLNRLRMNVRSFAEDARGNFAMMTGILLVPIVGIFGLALDHWAVSTAKSEIENAADAAALAIINRAAAIMRESGNQKLASEIGRNAGNDQFDANVGKIPDTKIEARKTTLSITGLVLESKIVWSAQSTTRFSSLFNWKRQSLEGVSSASVQLPAYVQIHVVVDNSGSMGIGATQAAQDELFKLNQCAIACHLNGTDKYNKARAAGIKTRIDVVRDVLVKVGEKSMESVSVPNQIKIGVYTFSNDFVQMVKITDQESTNMNKFKEKMGKDFGLTGVGGGTDYHGAFRELLKVLPKSGDGLTEGTPIVYIMFITDGIEHTQQNKGGGWWVADADALRKDGSPIVVAPSPPLTGLSATYAYRGQTRSDMGWIQPLDPRICTPIKQQGQLSTLEIEYIIPEDKYWIHNGTADVRFGWVKDKILAKEGAYTLSHNRFRKCASSPEDAHLASSDKEIEAAIGAMFAKVIPKPPRLLK
jgi:hypothetical protein